MRFPNTFVVFGSTMPPIVELLSDSAVALFTQRESVSDRSKAIVATFGAGYEYALPAWSKECMERIALEYVGPFQRELRYLCAAIALGKPYGPDGHEGSGGSRVEQTPIKPTPRGPSSIKLVRKSGRARRLRSLT